jgi:hypothetical protein
MGMALGLEDGNFKLDSKGVSRVGDFLRIEILVFGFGCSNTGEAFSNLLSGLPTLFNKFLSNLVLLICFAISF